MSDYISKTLLLHDIAVVASMMDDPIKIYDQMSAIVKESPTTDVVELKHGKWIDTEPHLKDWQQRKNGMAYYCSVCGHRAGKNKHRTYKYCPWCGARMDGEA